MSETEPWHLPHMGNRPNDSMQCWPSGDYLGEDECGPMYAVRPWKAVVQWVRNHALLCMYLAAIGAVVVGHVVAA